ncbi:MAG: hypothetical protein KJ556_04240 [Gammaproteobacteria bacterium]|nr:hypothetical protein [Gammaproteobacteria bacterium]MBU2057964.1 hypothetical protein [Gammaproteobacteria bacterium]MBU2174316.1 hypothetical protein [Gammaproteobacteria bacterium]MBU2247733.1 hypothetical protein [Gammaproteobacteria bacterium]MBU2344259.1 hypothetical protein [Gammaproteobacteria bacterium]
MIELLSLATLVVLLLSGIFFYKKTCRNLTVSEIEQLVSQQMDQRAHKLCMQAFYVQRAREMEERYKLEEQFQDDLHLYVEDFQAEVAESLQQNKVRDIQSYGFIRLTK